MNKREFLDTLRQALQGEVSPDITEQNIRYYDDYISSHSIHGEDAVLEELGNPRLIAKTIIESDKMAREKGRYTNRSGYQEDRYYQKAEYDDEEKEDDRRNGHRRNSIFFTGLRWYHKAVLWAVLIVFLLLLFFVGRVLISLLYVFAVPLILFVLIMSLFRRR